MMAVRAKDRRVASESDGDSGVDGSAVVDSKHEAPKKCDATPSNDHAASKAYVRPARNRNECCFRITRNKPLLRSQKELTSKEL